MTAGQLKDWVLGNSETNACPYPMVFLKGKLLTIKDFESFADNTKFTVVKMSSISTMHVE